MNSSDDLCLLFCLFLLLCPSPPQPFLYLKTKIYSFVFCGILRDIFFFFRKCDENTKYRLLKSHKYVYSSSNKRLNLKTLTDQVIPHALCTGVGGRTWLPCTMQHTLTWLQSSPSYSTKPR